MTDRARGRARARVPAALRARVPAAWGTEATYSTQPERDGFPVGAAWAAGRGAGGGEQPTQRKKAHLTGRCLVLVEHQENVRWVAGNRLSMLVTVKKMGGAKVELPIAETVRKSVCTLRAHTTR